MCGIFCFATGFQNIRKASFATGFQERARQSVKAGFEPSKDIFALLMKTHVCADYSKASRSRACAPYGFACKSDGTAGELFRRV